MENKINEIGKGRIVNLYKIIVESLIHKKEKKSNQHRQNIVSHQFTNKCKVEKKSWWLKDLENLCKITFDALIKEFFKK